MALVACKECGAQVSNAAPSCPKCGVPNPAGTGTGQLVIGRANQVRTVLNHVTVVIQGEVVGDLGLGKHFALDLPPGQYEVKVRGNLTSDSTVATVVEGAASVYEVAFNMLNLIKIRPAGR